MPAYAVTGGDLKAEVATTFDGAGGPPKRQITSFGYTNLQFGLGFEVGSTILSWLNPSLTGGGGAKSGSIIELNQGRAQSYLDFTDARFVAFTSPACDSASKGESVFLIEASITNAVTRQGDNAPVALPKRTPFLASNFGIQIDGITTVRTATIDAITFRRTPPGIAPSDLVVTFSDADLPGWTAWAQDFIVAGNNGQDKERQGAIQFLGPDLSLVATLAMHQIGIFELTPIPDGPGQRHRAKLYFESAQLSLP